MEAYKSIIADFNNDLWGHHFLVSRDIAKKYVEGTNRRVICNLNGQHTFHCALMPHGDGDFFINLNKEIRKKLHLKVGDHIEFTLKKDESKYGIPMPEEMSELLAIDDETDQYFHSLTPGKQRSLLYLIAKPKSSAIRLNKALAITDFLKINKGVLDYKLLHSYIKDYNNLRSG